MYAMTCILNLMKPRYLTESGHHQLNTRREVKQPAFVVEATRFRVFGENRILNPMHFRLHELTNSTENVGTKTKHTAAKTQCCCEGLAAVFSDLHRPTSFPRLKSLEPHILNHNHVDVYPYSNRRPKKGVPNFANGWGCTRSTQLHKLLSSYVDISITSWDDHMQNTISWTQNFECQTQVLHPKPSSLN